MELAAFFPMIGELPEAERAKLADATVYHRVPAGTVLHDGASGCTGLLLVASGQLRAYIFSPEGREITLYRLFERDVCLLSASCMIQSLQFDITVEAEKASEVWVIPAKVYQRASESCAALANYTNQIMASRFSEVMWRVEQLLWKSMDKRLAGFLLEESALEGSGTLHITHEKIANHLGTAREVVTRVLRDMQNEGLIRLSRGAVELTDEKRLRKLSAQ